MSVVFDKLSFVKRLEDGGGFSRPQAETLSDAFHQAASATVATKQELTSTRFELERSVGAVRAELQPIRSDSKSAVALIRSELKAGLAETKVWTVSVGATIVAVLAAMRYFG